MFVKVKVERKGITKTVVYVHLTDMDNKSSHTLLPDEITP